METSELYKFIRANSNRLTTDSRDVKTGDIFFALKGENFDGNRFAAKALDTGAVAAVIDDPAFAGRATILVDDVLHTLQELANIHRNNFSIPVLAITGTNGKTTTKELISRVLSKKYITHSTKGNLNNHIGVPLTLLSAKENTEFMIVEMGANHIGEIGDLCEIAEPDAGMITNIGRAHLEGFGSFEGVIKAKTELYTYLSKSGGTIIFNQADHLLSELANDQICTLHPYSRSGSEISTLSSDSDKEIHLKFLHNGEVLNIKSALFGEHNIENITAALAVGLYYGVPVNSIIKAIESYIPDNNRSQIVKTKTNTLLCDAYNANPDSMLMALDSFIRAGGLNSTVILGDMLELGEYSFEEHKKVVQYLSGKKELDVILVGDIFCEVAEGSKMRKFRSAVLLMDYLESNPIKDSFVLLKGSRAISLEKVFKVL